LPLLEQPALPELPESPPSSCQPSLPPPPPTTISTTSIPTAIIPIAAIPTVTSIPTAVILIGACARNASRATTAHSISTRMAALQKIFKKIPSLDVLPLLVLQHGKLTKTPSYQASNIQYECCVNGRMNVV
jgi:hypothetical protein